MALLLLESFRTHSVGGGATGAKWQTMGSVVSNLVSGRGRGGSVGYSHSTSGNTLSFSRFTPGTEFAVGFACYGETVPTSYAPVILAFNGAHGSLYQHVRLRMTKSGRLMVTTEASLSGNVTAPINFHSQPYVEIAVRIGSSDGLITIRVNEVEVLSLSSIDTRHDSTAATCQETEFSLGSAELWLDDVYIKEGLDFLGDIRNRVLMPDGDGNYQDFPTLTNAATHLEAVEDNPHTGDAGGFVASPDAGDKETFTLADLPAEVDGVLGVGVGAYMRHDSVASQAKLLCRSAGTDETGAAVSQTTAYLNHQACFDDDPAGGAWTVSDVNAMEAGVEVVASS